VHRRRNRRPQCLDRRLELADFTNGLQSVSSLLGSIVRCDYEI
jgi:hypothetical protein